MTAIRERSETEAAESPFQLAFVCPWATPREVTWSGTPHALFTALGRQNSCRIYDIDVAIPGFIEQGFRLVYARRLNGRFMSSYRFAPTWLRLMEYKVRAALNICSRRVDAVLQIGDFAPITERPNYSYMDLSLELLIRDFEENGRPMWNFRQFSLNDLYRRREWQARYLASCSGVFAMSAWLAESLKRDSGLPDSKIHVVRAGANVPAGFHATAKLLPKSTAPTILFVGRDFFRKGGELTVKAFQLLRREHFPEARLLIAGPERWPLPEAPPPGVEFLADASHRQLQQLFGAADVFCMPSYSEPFGIVFAEALNSGTPCIGRNCHAMPEIIRHGENGYLLQEDSVSALAQLLFNALTNENMRNTVIGNAPAAQAYYSWERVAGDVSRILHENNGRSR